MKDPRKKEEVMQRHPALEAKRAMLGRLLLAAGCTCLTSYDASGGRSR
ncbi:hypothetical protein GCM10020218_056850 [Dactylosporangium vinaceum]